MSTASLSETDKRIFGPLFVIPQELLGDFSMQGRCPILMQFRAETSGGLLNWTMDYWNALSPSIERLLATGEKVGYSSDAHLVELLRRHSPQEKSVIVIGSVHPLYEALVYRMGGRPSTVEFRKINHNIPWLETFTVDEFHAAKREYDYGLTISALEHDGLGRYGDPIDPNGDLKTMRSYKSYLKKGGLMFLSVPVGQDAVCWNSHRIYGRYRLPMLLDGWEIIDQSGFDPGLFDLGIAGQDYREPVLVLRNS